MEDLVHDLTGVELVYLGRLSQTGSLKGPLDSRNLPLRLLSFMMAHWDRQKCFCTARQSCWHRGRPTGSPSFITQSGKAYLHSKAWNGIVRYQN